MKFKTAIVALFATLFITVFSSSVFAETFSISAGVPISHDINNSNVKTDGVSGYMFHVKLPIMMGLGMESYDTKLKSETTTDYKLKTNLYDIFYMLPIPVINLTIGAGFGNVELECSPSCSDSYDKSLMTQFYGQLGYNIIPLIDVHVSYHSTNGKLKGKNGNDDVSVSGTVIGAGLSIVF